MNRNFGISAAAPVLHLLGVVRRRRPVHEHNTPESEQSVEEIITVVDPRHALYGQSFKLLGTTKQFGREASCVVWLQTDGFERRIPISATSRALEPPEIWPIRLNIKSVLQLLATADKYGLLAAEVIANETIQPIDNAASVQRTNLGASGVGDANPAATAARPANGYQCVLADASTKLPNRGSKFSQGPAQTADSGPETVGELA